MARRCFPLWIVCILALAGCSDREGVRSYSVPRTSEKSGTGAGPAIGGDYRILGAIYPADSPTWYFKLTGSAAELAKVEADFDKFIATVKLAPDNAVPTFKLPEGWTLGGPKSITRMGVTVTFDQTIKIDSLELTISKAAGGVLQNVGRWASQVGAEEVTAANLSKVTREFPADGTKGVRVDVQGKMNPAGGPMMRGKR